MTLTDTGPLLAIVDQGDRSHRLAMSAIKRVSLPMLTTLPVITESMYLLRSRVGARGQAALWKMMTDGRIRMADVDESTLVRMRELMDRYADTPMDFADASLVAVAEERGIRQIYTLDSHFRVYRLGQNEPFNLIPDIS